MNVFDLYAKISIDPSEFEKGLDQAKKKATDFAKNVSSLSSNINKVYSGVKDVLKPAVDGFKAVEGVGKKAGNAITTGLKGFAAAATAVGGFGTAAVKTGADFDATMSKVSATIGWTTEELHDQTSDASAEFSELRKKALEMGATTQFSASEAADALTYMAMAGWKTNDMLGGIKGIMDLAAASGEDLASTSDIVTDALTAFGMSASESGHFADILAKASSNSNTNVGLMGETFKYVAPVAGSLGYTAEDTAIAIGLMANSGIKASQAGTALRTILTNMTKPTDSMATAMEILGVSLDDGNDKMYSLGEVMDQLRDGFGTGAMSASDFREKFSELNEGLESGKYTQESYDKTLQDLIVSMYGAEGAQKAELAAMLAGKEGMSGLLAIVSAAPDDYEELRDAIYDCNGAAEQMAATMMDNLAGDMKYLSSAFESLQIAISDSLTPTLREFAQFGQKAMANLLEGFQGGGVSGFMTALSGIVTDGVTMLAEKAPEFASVSLQFVGALADGILGAKDSIGDSVSEVLYTITDGFGTWLSSNSAELADFGLDIVTIIFEGFRDAGWIISQNIGEFVPLIAAAFFQYHSALFEIGIDILGSIGRGIIEHKDEIAKWANFAITNMTISLRENAPDIIEGGLALLEALAGAIEENLPLILETGATIVGELISGISTASPGVQAIIATAVLPHILKIIEVVGDIGGVFKKVTDLITGGQGIGKILDIGKTLMGGISKLFGLIAANPVVAIIGLIIGAVVLLYTKCEWFRDAVHAVIDAVVGFFKGAWETVQAAWNGAGEFFGGIVDGIKGVFDGIGEFLGGLFSDAWDAVKNAWGAAKEFFGDLWNNIKEKAGDAASNIRDKLKEAWDGIKSAWDTAKTFFGDLWSSIKEKGGEAAEKVKDAFGKAWDAITSAWDGAMDFFGGVWDNIKGVFSNAWEAFKDIGGNIVKGIWDGISGAAGWLWDQISGFFGNIVDNAKAALGIHSPSKVFAGIGENMALGLGEGWDDEYRAIKSKIESGLNFGTASVGLVANGTYVPSRQAQEGQEHGPDGTGNTYVTINSPVAVDAVQAARVWKKTAQQMAMGYV